MAPATKNCLKNHPSMKKLLFITLVFLVWTGRALSQVSFPENDAVWKEEHITFAGPVLKHFALCGDTVLNGTQYSRVIELQLDSTGQVSGSTYLGGLRSTGSSVVFYSNEELTAYLLYDFSLQAGQTIQLHVPFLLDTITRTVDSVKSVLLAGAMRRVIYFKPGPGEFDPEFWIEGIGSSYGLLNRATPPGGDIGFQLLCYQHGSDYLNLTLIECFLPELTGCGLANSTEFTSKGDPLRMTVSPNPTASRLQFFINQPESLSRYNLKIYAANGKMLKVLEQVGPENTLPADVSLPPGFYIAVLDTKQSGRVMAHCTFVVQGD